MIVLDASAAVVMASETQEGKALAALLQNGEKAISVDLFHAEVANAFWQYSKAGLCSVEESIIRLHKASQLVDEFCPIDELYTEALSEAARLNHPVYDILYFVLTRKHAATLFTLDKKLQKICVENGVNCIETDDAF